MPTGMLTRARAVLRGIRAALASAVDLHRGIVEVGAIVPQSRLEAMAERLGSTREDVEAAVALVARSVPFTMLEVIDETWELDATSVAAWHHKALGRMRELEFRAIMGDPDGS